MLVPGACSNRKTTSEMPGTLEAMASPPTSNSTDAIALCLSGGGFRALLFHVGVLRRLNEFGMLSRLSVISSVSGGSILNGVLATRWSKLSLGPDGVFTNFNEVMGNAAEQFCQKD